MSAPIRRIPMPDVPFSAVNIDLVGPLPPCNGFRYLLTAVDRTTRWPEAFPVQDIATTTLVSAFIDGWVARFGVPSTLTSDRGAQFTGSMWTALCSTLGCNKQLTTSYRPQANGLVERFHRRMKDALRARLNGRQDWQNHLPWVMLGVRTAPREESSSSAAQHALGTSLFLPGQFVSDETFGDVVDRLKHGLPPLETVHNRRAPQRGVDRLKNAPMVFVRNDHLSKPTLAPLYTGPFEVVGRHESHYDVKVGDKVEPVNIHRLKPVLTDANAQPALPPRRGRPPRPAASPSHPPADLWPTQRRRGRPPKTAANPSPRRRRRGRPPKTAAPTLLLIQSILRNVSC